MCFAPPVSLGTAIVEFVFVILILTYFKRTTLTKYFAALIAFLGLYQFTEFMLCTSTNPFLWAQVGFIAYSFLPAIFLDLVIRFTKRQGSRLLIYLIPTVATILVLFNFIQVSRAECSSVFILVDRTITNQVVGTFFVMYLLFYFISIVFCAYFIGDYYKKTKSLTNKRIAMLLQFSTYVSLLPPLTLFIILPNWGIYFPSVYCEFALLLAIGGTWAAYLESKKDNKEVKNKKSKKKRIKKH